MLDRPHAYNVEAIPASLGERWLITESYQKPYAVCRYVHAAIDAVLALVAEHPEGPAIERLVVELFDEARRIPNPLKPPSLEAAQFSTPFGVALAALRGAEAFRPLQPQHLADGEVLALAEKVELQYPDEFVGVFPGNYPARVTMIRGAQKFTKTVLSPLGDPANPMGRADLEHKLRALGRDLLSPAEIEEIIGAIAQLRTGRGAPLQACLQRFPAERINAKAAKVSA